MAAISSSTAVQIRERLLPQHQAALTLIKSELECPAKESFNWLDLGCGRGQIILHAEQFLGRSLSGKINFVGVDVNQDYVRETEQIAKSVFPNCDFIICSLENFEHHLGRDDQFDFVSFTNTAHEISPCQLGNLLISAFSRLSDTGQFFVYDMESLQAHELGAVTWRSDEIEKIVHQMLIAAGGEGYLPTVSRIPHKTCDAWYFKIDNKHSKARSSDFKEGRDKIVNSIRKEVYDILSNKIREINMALERLCRYGETENSTGDTNRLLFDHWAVTRALTDLEDGEVASSNLPMLPTSDANG